MFVFLKTMIKDEGYLSTSQPTIKFVTISVAGLAATMIPTSVERAMYDWEMGLPPVWLLSVDKLSFLRTPEARFNFANMFGNIGSKR